MRVRARVRVRVRVRVRIRVRVRVRVTVRVRVRFKAWVRVSARVSVRVHVAQHAEGGNDRRAQRRLVLLVLLEHAGLQAHVVVDGVPVDGAELERLS